MSVAVRGSANSTVISSVEYHYEYDTNGNITQVYSGDVLVYQYAYDDLGQLIREDNYYLNKSYVYAYDNAGNLTDKKEYAFTTGTLGSRRKWSSFTYENTAWGDQLTTYDGPMYWVDYDEIGNPTRYGYGPSRETDYMEEGYELTWNGRELVTFRKCSDFDSLRYTSEFTYTYNADGIRTSKTINGIKHEYYLSGSKIMAEIWVEDDCEHVLIYLYDESGSPIGLTYQDDTYSHTLFERFFFEKNLQGDIVAVYNEFGKKIGSYYYDAWGNHTVVTESGNNWFEDEIVNNYNPFRYRGYYYDVETGFYYLQSRYYNPEWGRFLNADSALYHSMLGYNMYAYCYNNPVNYYDPTGESAAAAWGSSMWWLCYADGPIPAGDFIYFAGLLILGGMALENSLPDTSTVSPTLPKADADNSPKAEAEDPPQSVTGDAPEVDDGTKKDKDARLKGKPGEVKTEGNKQTHIGKDGRADKERHNTDHGKPKYHTNPHDHNISWDQNGNPNFGDPQNYWDGNIPVFP